MNEDIKKDIADSITQSISYLKQDNSEDLKELSNHNIHNASIYHDGHSIVLAVIIYSLSKISLKPYNKILVLNLLNKMKQNIKSNNPKEYEQFQRQLLAYIRKNDTKFSSYISEVLTQAQIKKGTALYEHGLSSETATSILGISQWDLMNYLGNVKAEKFPVRKTDIKSRLEFTRGLFN